MILTSSDEVWCDMGVGVGVWEWWTTCYARPGLERRGEPRRNPAQVSQQCSGPRRDVGG